jgi:mRNA-degrading endonuclease RelE of RelBE toxin-antitoxin system
VEQAIVFCGLFDPEHDQPLFRLRIGDWRVIYRRGPGGAIEIVRVSNRREAYR